MNAVTSIEPETTAATTVPTELGHLHVTVTGTGPETILLWPSIFTDHRIYGRLVHLMAQDARFVLIDEPGHGRSGGAEAESSMAECAAAMAGVMDHLGVRRAIVGGTSWGGIVGAHLALSDPERVKALILMNTPMEIDASRPGLRARFISAGARWMLGTRAFRNGNAKSFFSPRALDADPAFAAAFHEMLMTSAAPALATAVRSVLLRAAPLKPRLAEIAAPTLVVAGMEDRMYPIERQAEAALRLPNGHFAPVPGKHISVVECPDRVAGFLGDFIRREVGQ